MPLPKRHEIAPTSSSTRFANFETDPKFRLPPKKHAKTKLDSRFSRLRTDPDFQSRAPVDRYGRRTSEYTTAKATDRFDDSDAEAIASPGDAATAKQEKRDAAVRRQLAKARQRGLDPIRDGGLSSSSEESSDDTDGGDDVENHAELAGEGNAVPTGDVTSRLAAVNLDWDNIRATDIMAVASSFVPDKASIRSVTIYPSDFGLERMQREEIEGPPKEIFAVSGAGKKNITARGDLGTLPQDEEQVKENDGEEFDSKALRAYQLDRLRYYYAIISCSSPSVAKSIYDNLDGREYLSSANFFDLRFVPDETEFDADPHDECEDLPHGYKPNDFVTGALSHSKVSLTWDADDVTRREAQKRAFSRKEIDENELKAYLGTESSSSEDEVDEKKASKAADLRAALGLAPAGKSSMLKNTGSSKRDRDLKKPDGEIEITFTTALSANGTKGSVFENEPEENTLEKYVRKQKERKEKRKARARAMKEGRISGADSGDEQSALRAEENDGFDDPFFDSDADVDKALELSSKKMMKMKKRTEREREEMEAAAERAKLELLMVDDEDSKLRHFDMNDILKAEKSKKKGKKGKRVQKDIVEDDFTIDTNDPRFAKLYESHDFAIDPTNPRFKDTAGMKALLEETRKKRKRERDEKPGEKRVKHRQQEQPDELHALTARLKARNRRN